MESIKYISNKEVIIKIEKDGDHWIGNAYRKDGWQITETDWCWDTREEAIQGIKETVDSGNKFYMG